MTNPMQDKKRPFKGHTAKHFRLRRMPTAAWRPSRSIGPEKKNPLTFESYEELGDLFRSLARPATCAPWC